MAGGGGAPLVELVGLRKAFDGVAALRGVTFSAAAGAVTALVGENGAGKSTLLRLLSGVLRPDAGEIRVAGEQLVFGSPRDAQAAGIAIIHQELNVLPELSVAENVFLSRLPVRGPLLDRRRLAAETRAVLAPLGAGLDPNRRVGALGPARQQLVEIARAIALRARIIAMDEPTASLTRDEAARLFEVVRRLRAGGVAVIFVSHRLEEVFAIADRITVLRDGEVVGSSAAGDIGPERVVELMVGRTLDRQFPEVAHVPTAEPVLEVRHLGTRELLRDVSLTVHRGEIVGLAGLVGAGRTELARAVFGADAGATGEVLLGGRPVHVRGPRDAIRLGIGFVTEDRKRSGLILDFRLSSNHTLPSLRRFTRFGRVSRPAEGRAFRARARQLNIRARGPAQRARFLSGGNQQKAVLAKWLELEPKLLILDEPTRGVDVGAKAELYAIMDRLAAAGTGILMISSDLPEVLGMSDRVVVLHEGRVTGEFDRREATEERVMRAAIS